MRTLRRARGFQGVLTTAAEHGVIQCAFDTVVWRELHEVEDWMRYDGKPLKEPQPHRTGSCVQPERVPDPGRQFSGFSTVVFGGLGVMRVRHALDRLERDRR